MTCYNCGREIDNNVKICPFCGCYVQYDNGADGYAYNDSEQVQYEDEQYDNGQYEDGYEEGYEEAPENAPEKKRGLKLPSFSKTPTAKKLFVSLSPGTIFSAICLILCVICLVKVSNIEKQLDSKFSAILSATSSTQQQMSEVTDRLDMLDSTLAGVQTEAYNQLASQTITIAKDITALTGPVTAGKYNVMFIINVKGNLNVSDSFDWQKYNESTGGWVSVVFSGAATTNEEYGLRLENAYDKTEGVYVSKLWANGITPEAAGTYRCVITDQSGITKKSAEAVVQVSTD